MQQLIKQITVSSRSISKRRNALLGEMYNLRQIGMGLRGFPLSDERDLGDFLDRLDLGKKYVLLF